MTSQTSWVPAASNENFPLQHLPLGVAQFDDGDYAVVTRLGNHIIRLDQLAERGMFEGTGAPSSDFVQPYLNTFIGRGKEVTSAVRRKLTEAFSESNSDQQLRDDLALYSMDAKDTKLVLPVDIGDYTDFYSSIEHATNVGTMFRDPNNALLPNWKHLPVGYHGRASSITVSGTPVRRPLGQKAPQEDGGRPGFGPSKLLDFELEMAFVVGQGNELGSPVDVAEAEDHIFGIALFNDWSARDIQKWEYVPLGPFLGKSFASTMSPWITPLEALEPARVESPEHDPAVLPYLDLGGKHNFDIKLQVFIQPEGGEETLVCESNTKYLYWSMAQQLAHHTINGCNLQPGDVCASGTISGPTAESYGSMLELSWRGSKPLTLKDGSTRTFIQDGDTVIMRAHVDSGEAHFNLGEVRSTVLPAREA